jgi:hypothetical protein
MNITYDKKRQLIDFTMERQEDHFALTLGELDNIQEEAVKAFRSDEAILDTFPKERHNTEHKNRFDLNNCIWCRWEFDDMSAEIVG